MVHVKKEDNKRENKTIELRTRLSRIIVGCVLIIILLKVHEIDQEGRGKNENTLRQSRLRRENNNEGIGIGELVSITKNRKRNTVSRTQEDHFLSIKPCWLVL